MILEFMSKSTYGEYVQTSWMVYVSIEECFWKKIHKFLFFRNLWMVCICIEEFFSVHTKLKLLIRNTMLKYVLMYCRFEATCDNFFT